MNIKRSLIILGSALLLLGATAHSLELKVSTTHPLLSDLVRQVGGDAVEVIDLLKPGGDVHHFEPSASDLRAIQGATILFASGKDLEPYLGKLKDSLGANVTIVEVGKTIPSLKISADDALFLCCPAHSVGSIDPHWWHSADNMARAAGVVAKALIEADPVHKSDYAKRGKETAARMKALKKWAQTEISAIPKEDRKLVTAHAAFGYFCKEYAFRFVPIMGLAREEDYSAKFVAEALKVIRDEKIRAVFPEDQANPKILREIAQQTGIKLASPLIADGTKPGAGSTFEGMLRHNVGTILKALKPTKK
ncbi:MAG: metal ABC transporter substrate-binding protein [Verrucomicrobia bacterium]|nr:metal ABC transporter substrate-binding protein [Verrucomicrobiota bacterium]